jgi:hypothetical protein
MAHHRRKNKKKSPWEDNTRKKIYFSVFEKLCIKLYKKHKQKHIPNISSEKNVVHTKSVPLRETTTGKLLTSSYFRN